MTNILVVTANIGVISMLFLNLLLIILNQGREDGVGATAHGATVATSRGRGGLPRCGSQSGTVGDTVEWLLMTEFSRDPELRSNVSKVS